MLVHADSVEERDSWIQALQQAISNLLEISGWLYKQVLFSLYFYFLYLCFLFISVIDLFSIGKSCAKLEKEMVRAKRNGVAIF